MANTQKTLKLQTMVVTLAMLIGIFCTFGVASASAANENQSENTSTVDEAQKILDTTPVNNEEPIRRSKSYSGYVVMVEPQKLYYETDCFSDGALDHIFNGNLNGEKATGFHYLGNKKYAKRLNRGVIVAGTETVSDENGVYQARVEIQGRPKKQISNFFPDFWKPQDVVNAIVEANECAETYQDHLKGKSKLYNNIEIHIYRDADKKINSAFPEYKKFNNLEKDAKSTFQKAQRRRSNFN